MENKELRNDLTQQEELIAKGRKLHTEAVQQAITFLPKELGKSISKLFGAGSLGAHPAK
ncbi:hypothetical protein [Desulforhopalus sp. 52FAK]